MDWFKKHTEAVVAKVVETVEKASELDKAMGEKPAEEWIWIKGYKGTDKDMKCRDYQFELNRQFDISDDKPVELCAHGFHLCKQLGKVYNYYGVGNGNRFFEVKALVRAKDYDNLGPQYFEDHYGFKTRCGEIDKLAAKSIIFTRELTVDEILGNCVPAYWTNEEKKLALEIGIREAREKITLEKLVALGYSETFAMLCIEQKRDEVALSVGTQEGLSMDMKAYLIFNISNNK
jgi:hypothetical protein